MSRIYFLEIIIYDLNLEDQIIKDSGDTVFLVKVNFIDLPPFQITRQNLSTASIKPVEDPSRLEFRAGQACHFTITPDKLAKKIIKHPFSVKIFRRGDSFPMCLAELPLSGCLCDQVSQRNSETIKPFVFGGTINLVDIGCNPSGYVNINLRLTCQGTYVLTSYALEKGSSIFKNDHQDAEFRVEAFPNEEDKPESNPRQLPWEDLTRDVAGIFPSAGRLAAGKPTPMLPLAPLGPSIAEKPLEIVAKEKNKMKKKKK